MINLQRGDLDSHLIIIIMIQEIIFHISRYNLFNFCIRTNFGSFTSSDRPEQLLQLLLCLLYVVSIDIFTRFIIVSLECLSAACEDSDVIRVFIMI